MALIDREKLSHLFRKKADDYSHFSTERRMLNFGAILTESMDAVDAVEVVRCRDCKYADWKKDFGLYFCHAGGDSWNEADFFCADGERREDDD